MGDILPDVDIDIAVIRGPEFRLRGLVEIVAVSALHLVEGQVSFAGAFRTEYGSVAPTAIVGPAILATAVSTGIAIFYIKIRKYI